MARRTSHDNPYDGDPWPSYVPIAERRRKAKLAMETTAEEGPRGVAGDRSKAER